MSNLEKLLEIWSIPVATVLMRNIRNGNTPKRNTVNLPKLLVNLGFAKDERKAMGQIDGGNVSLGYYAFPAGTKILTVEGGYRSSAEMQRFEEVIPKKKYIMHKCDIVDKVLIVGKKQKYIDKEDLK